MSFSLKCNNGPLISAELYVTLKLMLIWILLILYFVFNLNMVYILLLYMSYQHKEFIPNFISVCFQVIL